MKYWTDKGAYILNKLCESEFYFLIFAVIQYCSIDLLNFLNKDASFLLLDGEYLLKVNVWLMYTKDDKEVGRCRTQGAHHASSVAALQKDLLLAQKNVKKKKDPWTYFLGRRWVAPRLCSSRGHRSPSTRTPRHRSDSPTGSSAVRSHPRRRTADPVEKRSITQRYIFTGQSVYTLDKTGVPLVP